MHFSLGISLLLAAFSVDARPWLPGPNKAIYVLTNNAENAVIGLPVNADGMVGEGQVTMTGGSGKNALGANNMPAAPDSLFSQGALAVAREYVFAVNPGSNTLSMLRADCDNPSRLTLIGQPVAIPGDFPNTVAASAKNQLVCVGTTGAKAGISCASFQEDGLGVMDELRPFDLDQSTPPTGPPNTVSQVFFSADESHLFATVKGNPNTDNHGFFSVFPLEYELWSETAVTVARQDIRSSFNSTALLFGSAVIPGTSHVFVTDPTFGVAVLDVDPRTNEATLYSKRAIPGQMATCWASYSPHRDSVFVTDGALSRLVELNANDGSISSTTVLSNQDQGYLDIWAAGDFVYALSPGNGTIEASITVFETTQGKQVQRALLGNEGAGKNAMGMAFIEF